MISNVGIDITTYCNLQCKHCLREKDSPRKHISLATVRKILEQSISIGIESSSLTGGEISLHPQLQDIFNTLAEYEVFYNFVTNGMLFNEKIIPALNTKNRRYLTSICFSLDGATAKTHDDIRGEGSFDKVIAAIRSSVGQRIPTYIKSVIYKNNLHELYDTAFLCAELGITNLGFIVPTPTPELAAQNLMPSLQEWNGAIREIKSRIMPLFALKIEIEGYADPHFKIPFCNPTRTLSFDHEGNMIFCCNLSHPTKGDGKDEFGREFIGNIHKMDIKKAVSLHYERLGWFIEHTMKRDYGEFYGNSCADCFKLFQKMNWEKHHETANS